MFFVRYPCRAPSSFQAVAIVQFFLWRKSVVQRYAFKRIGPSLFFDFMFYNMFF